jgi:apolipoprotein D and lipocalin family protein
LLVDEEGELRDAVRELLTRHGLEVPSVRHDRACTARERADVRVLCEGASMRVMRRPGRIALIAVVLAAGAGCATTTTRRGLPPLRTVERVDLARYAGTWFEIASFPQPFQAGCVASRAIYTMADDGSVTVVNRCRDRTLDGPERSVVGTARVVDPATNATLSVSFQWPFRGAYWVIDLDPDYRWAVVGHPSRDYLWILSRTPELAADTYDAILARLRQQGYDIERLRRTPQR